MSKRQVTIAKAEIRQDGIDEHYDRLNRVRLVLNEIAREFSTTLSDKNRTIAGLLGTQRMLGFVEGKFENLQNEIRSARQSSDRLVSEAFDSRGTETKNL